MAIYGYPFSFLFNQMRDGADGSLAGGSVTFYAAGTTTPKAVWLDRAMTSPSVGGILTPVTLTADGTAAIFGLGLYKVVIKNSTGVTVYTYDNINMIDPTYTDNIADQLANIASLTSPAQAQIDGKVAKTTVVSTSTGVVDNTLGVNVTLSSTNSSTGKSASVATKSTGYSEVTGTDGVTLTAPVTTVSANLGFAGSFARILADFSNASTANKCMFQTSTVNGATTIGVLPNGTSVTTTIRLYGNADPTNCSVSGIDQASSGFAIRSTRVGAGSYLPLFVTVDNTTAIYITASGTATAGSNPLVLIGATADDGSGAKLQSAGNFSLTSGSSVMMKSGGFTARIGQSTLVAGTVTVSNTTVTANTRIFLTVSTVGGTPGSLRTAKSAGTSFTISSSNVAETSTVDWFMIESF